MWWIFFDMVYNPDIHHRRSIRLSGYDYAGDGAYFITICAYHRRCLFGKIVNKNGKPVCVLNKYGQIAHDELIKTATIRKNVALDCFVVMPNHVHALVVVGRDGGGTMGGVGVCGTVGAYGNTPLRRYNTQTTQCVTKIMFRSPSDNMGSLVRGYKSTVTKQINELRKTPCIPVWQRNYYENIVRDQRSLENIRNYILNNPRKWLWDCFDI